MSDETSVARLAEIIDHYMQTRKRPALISTAKAARAITAWISVSPDAVAALESAIANAAEKYGHAVEYDLRSDLQFISKEVLDQAQGIAGASDG